jgi:hypothetical protein
MVSSSSTARSMAEFFLVVYDVVERQTTDVELGADFLDRLAPERLTRQLVKRLEKPGHRITLEPQQDAA